MKIDETLQHIGEFGRFQKRIYTLLAFPGMTSGAFCMMLVVLLYTPRHRCKIPGYENDTYAIQSPYHELLVNKTIPRSVMPGVTYDRCTYFTAGSDVMMSNDVMNNNTAKEACSEWVYEDTVFYQTFTTVNNYVCKDAMKTSHIQMLFYFGLLVGDLMLGLFADAYGRMKALYLGMVLTLVVSVAVSWAPEFFSFAIMQFIIGGGAHGAFVCYAVITMEITGPKKRMIPGMMIQAWFAVGICYVGVVSYLIRSWRWINLATALPCVLYLSYWWLVPETPRWLLSKGRRDEGIELLKKMAKVNKHADVSDDVFDVTVDKHVAEGKIWHLLQRPVLRRRFLILAFNWMVITMTYYGVTMNAGNLGGDFHINFILLSLAEIVGTVMGTAVLNRIGRRWTNAGSLVLAGIACLATIPCLLIPGKGSLIISIILALIGKAMSTAAFGVVYVFSAELLPTVVRNAAVGLCSCAGRIGSMIAPYVAKSADTIGGPEGGIVPLVVFGVLSVVAGCLLFLLPETLNQRLPDSMDEGEQFGRKPLEEVESKIPLKERPDDDDVLLS